MDDADVTDLADCVDRIVDFARTLYPILRAGAVEPIAQLVIQARYLAERTGELDPLSVADLLTAELRRRGGFADPPSP